MNEQDLAHELGALLDGRFDSSSALPVEETAFAVQLKALAEGTKADAAFAAALETRLRAPDPSFGHPLGRQKQGVFIVRRPHYRLAALVAAVLVVAFVGLTLPQVRDLVFQGAVTEEIAVVTPTTVANLPPDPVVDSVVVSAPIRGGFRIMGDVLNYDGFYWGLIESTFASYVDLMWSADHDHVQS